MVFVVGCCDLAAATQVSEITVKALEEHLTGAQFAANTAFYLDKFFTRLSKVVLFIVRLIVYELET